MSNNDNNVLGFILLGLIIAFVVAAKWYSVWKQRKREASYPKTWEIRGVAPPGIDVALEVIHAMVPPELFRRWGGIIEFVPGPWFIYDTMKVAGTVENHDIPYIKLMYTEKIEDGALTHEFQHIIDHRQNKDSEHTESFYVWPNVVRKEIARRLGR